MVIIVIRYETKVLHEDAAKTNMKFSLKVRIAMKIKVMTSVMTTTILLLLVSSSVLLGTLSYSSASPAGSPIIVPDDFDTIQAAIDAAYEGDTILVKPGVYNERLVISKSLKLLGFGNSTIIQGDGNGDTVHISRGTVNVTFAGFTVMGSKAPLWAGIYIGGLNCTIKNNKVTGHYLGIYMWDSSGNVLRDNNLTGNRYNLEVWGLSLQHFLHDIDASNRVNGKPVYYWVNQRNRTVPLDAGYVALVNSSNIIVKNLDLSHNGQGVLFAYTNNSVIKNVNSSNNVRGFHILLSHNNSFTGNYVSENVESGILLLTSSNNLILQNTVTTNKWGIFLSFSSLLRLRSNQNTINGNIITNNYDAIYLQASRGNMIGGNQIAKNQRCGLVFELSNNNVVVMNTLVNNQYDVQIYRSRNNLLYHNNFLDNTAQVVIKDSFPSVNLWDDGYPSGGNYWANYNGTDFYNGVFQNEIGSDSIGDSPYAIGAENEDRYPLMNPWIEIQDVEVVEVKPSATEIYAGWRFNVTVTVRNNADVDVSFNLTVFALSISQTILFYLPPNGNITSTLTLETIDVPVSVNYITWAKASIVPNEINVLNNIFVGSAVKIKMLGDVNGDAKIDIVDVAQAALAFGSYPNHPRWNIQADIVQDSKVNIRDLATVAANFGKQVNYEA